MTHRHFDTEHTKAFKQTLLHKRFYTQRLLHTEAFTHSTQKLCTHRKNCNFTSVFGDRPSFRAKGLQREPGNRNFTSVFGDRPSFRAKGLATGTWKSQFYHRFFAIEPHFVRKAGAEQVEIAVLPQFLALEPHFVRKAGDWTFEIAILPQFLTIELHFVRKGCAGRLANRNFTSVFWRSNLIPCERVARDDLNSQFYLSF